VKQETLVPPKKKKKDYMIKSLKVVNAHIYNPNTQEAEVGELQV
jgi:hypothetical protein